MCVTVSLKITQYQQQRKEEIIMTKMLKLPEVLDRVGLSRSMVYRMMSENRFPQVIKICNASRWSEKSIEDWLQTKIKESSGN